MNSFRLNGYKFSFLIIEENEYIKRKIYAPDKELYLIFTEDLLVCKLIKFEFKTSKIKSSIISNFVFSLIHFNDIEDIYNISRYRSLFGRKFDYIISDNIDYLLNKKQTLELFK